MNASPQSLKDLIRLELPRLYAFSYQMNGSRMEAERFLADLCASLPTLNESKILSDEKPFEALLGVLARQVEEALGRRSDQSFDSLDNILRTDLTRPIDLNRAGFAEDPGRVHVMLWQLKRTCLTSVMGCLPPGVRLSFVLTDLWGINPTRAAELLEIKESAYRVRLTRARKRIEDYLAPRCAHVDRQNPCTCIGRLMIAMDAGFVQPPPHNFDTPHDPYDADGPRRDVGSLFRALPAVQLSELDAERILSACPA